MVVNAIWGFNPLAIIGALSLMILFFPVLGLAFESDPQVAQAVANNTADRIINALPSLIIGELAGSVAATTFKAFKGI